MALWRRGTLCAVVWALLGAQVAVAQVIVYVNAAATTGANNGSSWANAFHGSSGVKSALAAAAPIASGGTPVQIWIAAGTYKPTPDTTISASFHLINSVAVYGGFAGNETQLVQRNPSANATILSGILSTSPPARSRHVVQAATGIDRSAILDGVTVTGGECWDSQAGTDRSGAGLLITSSSPTISGVSFLSNGMAIRGGGAANLGTGSPLFQNCTFKSNRVFGNFGGVGAGFFSESGSPELIGCWFESNSAGANGTGGGVGCTGGSLVMTDCTVTKCDAEGPGGLWSSSVGLIRMLRCTISENRAFGYGGAQGFFEARQCIFRANRINGSGGNYAIGSFSNSSFIDCDFIGNPPPGEISGVGAMVASSSRFVRCRFLSNRGSFTLRALSSTRFEQCLFNSNSGGSGGVVNLTDSSMMSCTVTASTSSGSAVQLNGSSELLNSIIWGNTGFTTPQVTVYSGDVRYSTIGGWTGGGVGNSTLDPMFADPLGPDGLAATDDDDLRLLPGSPALDSADADALPPDTFDIDGDGNTTEPLPLDFDNNPRWADNPAVPNSGVGFVPYLDRGVYERPPGASGLTSFWNSPSGGVFTQSSNWLTTSPGPADESLFDIGGAFAVQFNADAAFRRASIRSGSLTFDLAGRTLSLSDPQSGFRLAPSSAQAASVHLTGGTIDTQLSQVRANATLTGETTFTGSLQVAGTLSPGGAGIGSVAAEGLYQQFITTPTGQTTSGTLVLDVGGEAAAQYDRLITSGGYSLLGLLRINATNNFDPPPNLNLRLIDASGATSTTGTFSAVLLPALSAGSGGEFRFYYITYGGQDQGGSVFLNVGTLGGLIGYGAGVNPATTASTPTAMALGDLNGDTLPDLVLTLPGVPGSVLVFKNLGTSGGDWLGWSAPTQYPVGNEPGGIAIGDLDSQLGADIAISNTGRQTSNPPDPGSVSILVNDGTGNFTVRPAIGPDILGVSGSAPRGIVIANVLGGPFSPPDMVIALSGNPTSALILENLGSFAVSTTPVPIGPRPTSASVRDLDGDGDLDLVFSNVGDGTVAIRLNTPSQPFTTGSTHPVGAVPTQVLARDLTGDLLPEIVTIDESSGTISILVNRGGGAFDPRVALPAGSPAQSPRALAILDMDQDQDADIAFIAGSDANIKIYRNDLTGGQLVFTLDAALTTPGIALLVDSADVTGDGRADLVPIVNGPADSPQAYVLPSRFRSSCFTANCDGSTTSPVLTANDFICFLGAFAAGNPVANCDESTTPPVLSANDFVCFINAFAAGCP